MSTIRAQKRDLHCEQCGDLFHASRIDAKFCSHKCRRIVTKKRQAIYDFEIEFYKRLREIESLVADRNVGPDAFHVLTEIERKVCKVAKQASKSDMAKSLQLQA